MLLAPCRTRQRRRGWSRLSSTRRRRARRRDQTPALRVLRAHCAVIGTRAARLRAVARAGRSMAPQRLRRRPGARRYGPRASSGRATRSCTAARALRRVRSAGDRVQRQLPAVLRRRLHRAVARGDRAVAGDGRQRHRRRRGRRRPSASARLRASTTSCSCSAQVTRLGTTSITTQIDVVRGPDVLVSGTLRHVCVATDTWAKTDAAGLDSRRPAALSRRRRRARAQP